MSLRTFHYMNLRSTRCSKLSYEKYFRKIKKLITDQLRAPRYVYKENVTKATLNTLGQKRNFLLIVFRNILDLNH